METREDKEKKHKRIGWISALGTQLILLILFYFLIAWKEPFPPIPSYGIELSFGIEDAGTGQQPVTNPNPQEESEATESEADEVESTEEVLEESTPEETAPEETTEQTDVVEEPLTETASPHVVEPKPTETIKEQPKPEPTPTDTKKTEPKPTEETKKINPEATMPSANKANETNDSKGTTEAKGSEGKKEGSLDGRALMGDQGTSGGANLNMSGWTWDAKPNPKDDSSESGKIIYRVKIDDAGYIIGLELVSSTVSPVVERYYRQSVEKITFSQTTNTTAAPSSTGTITFIIRSK